LPCTVREIQPGAGTHVEVALSVSPRSADMAESGPQTVLARITQKSLTDMKLETGKRVHALVKAVAIDRHSLGGYGPGTNRQ